MVNPPTEREKVLFGKHGWLFLQRDTNDVIGQHTGRVRLGRERRRTWKRLLRQRKSLMKRLGVAWLCQIAPDKESVYPEYLPPEVIPSARRPVHELLKVARSVGAPVAYPLDDILAAKNDEPLYLRADTHWNQRGSYAAYRSLCNGLLGMD